MPEIEVRHAIASDIPELLSLNHRYTSEYVWQMEFTHERDGGVITNTFRQVRLPRAVLVDYPRSPRKLFEDWEARAGVLTATLDGKPVGYVSVEDARLPYTTWITDLAVAQPLRRQGIASALVLSAQEWALQAGSHALVMEMAPKNHPAIQLALKLGFEFCGYNDRHYHKNGAAIFFGKNI